MNKIWKHSVWIFDIQRGTNHNNYAYIVNGLAVEKPKKNAYIWSWIRRNEKIQPQWKKYKKKEHETKNYDNRHTDNGTYRLIARAKFSATKSLQQIFQRFSLHTVIRINMPRCVRLYGLYARLYGKCWWVKTSQSSCAELFPLDLKTTSTATTTATAPKTTTPAMPVVVNDFEITTTHMAESCHKSF